MNNFYTYFVNFLIFFFLKRSANAVSEWSRLVGGTMSDVAFSITSDSLNNLYISGMTPNNPFDGQTNNGSNDAFITKYDSSGNLQWQRTIGFEIVGVVADSSGNVYGITSTNILVKWNSSGTLQWKYTFTTTTPSFANNYGGVFTGSDGSVYVTGAFNDKVVIIKLNSSGVPQWARQLAAGLVLSNLGGIYLDANDTIYLSGTYRPASGNDYKIYIAKLPGDGSKTGSYTVDGVSYTYSSVTTPGTATSAAADGTGAATTATPAFTASAISATDVNPNLTSATTAL
jgi:hypothetical protein